MYEELVKSLKICGTPALINEKCIAFHDGCCEAEPVCMYELMRKAADAIEELSRFHEAQRQNLITLMNEDPEMEWIPVTERLPERGYYVLVYEDGDILMASYADGNWVLRDMYEVVDDLKPTYWMPLPELPKEGE